MALLSYIKAYTMKKLLKKTKKFLRKNKEDFKYLLFAGVPAGLLMIVLGCSIELGEVY